MTVQLSRRHFLSGVAASAAVTALPLPSWAQFGPAPGIVQLDSNENPYGPSPRALKAAYEAAQKGAYYPGAVARRVTAMIAEKNGLETDNVTISTGSAEALCAAMAAYGKQGRILSPELTFSAHLRYAERIGYEVEYVPLKADMSIDLDAMEAAIDDGVSLVYVCNPNNPTGMVLDGDQLRAFCSRVQGRVPILIDEAYIEITDRPDYTAMTDLVRKGDNVMIMRTFSKIYGMAGMRLGYTLAKPEIIELVGDHVMSWPNVMAYAAAEASFNDQVFLDYSLAKIREGREMVIDTFRRHEIDVLPSQTNFVYADIGRNADDFRAALRERGVHIRGIYKPYDTYSRVSMGKLEDLEVFSRAFHEAYAG